MKNNLRFNTNLKSIRKSKGITQIALAKELGVPYQTINKYENTDIMPRIDIIIKIASVLNVSVDELLGLPKTPKTLLSELEAMPQTNLSYNLDEVRGVVRVSSNSFDKIIEVPFLSFMEAVKEAEKFANLKTNLVYEALRTDAFIEILLSKQNT